jgi:hypothetical protein
MFFPEVPAMRFPRVRFRVRTMMVAVAVVSAIFFTSDMWSRSAEYQTQANWHAAQEFRFSPSYDDSKYIGFPPSPPLSPGRKAHLWKLHARMKDKYARAAHRPWAYVEPDPPLSEFMERDE